MIKRIYSIAISLIVLTMAAHSQNVGIGQISPASKLDVKGNLTIGTTYSGTTAPTNGAIIQGYVGIGNTSPSSLLSVGSSSQFQVNSSGNLVSINGVSYSWPTTEPAAGSVLVSDGSGNMSWSTSAAGTSGWSLTGNSLTNSSTNFIGTTDSMDFIIKTNNKSRIHITASGSILYGSSSFDLSNPENMLINAGTTNSSNVATFKGSINNYLQVGVQNNSSANTASSDMVATADNGTDTSMFIDMGINGSHYTASNNFGGANDGYLYTYANNLLVGTQATGKSLIFMTGGGTTSTNERMIINGSGLVGIGTASPTSLLSVGASSQFQINSSGDLVAVKGVTYSWPTSNPGSGSARVLQNDGSGNLTWVAASAGTLTGVTASSPLSSSGGVTPNITLGTVPVANGGTGTTTLTSNGIIYGNGTSTLGATAAGSQGQHLTINSSGVPVWTTATYPSTTTANQLLYSSANNTVTGLTAGTNGQVLTISSGVPTWATAASGTVISVGLLMPSIFSVTNSPVTSTGTLTTTLASETANTIFAAPNGSTGTPTFRALVNADLPTSGITAGTYNNVTVNAQGIATSGSNVTYLTSAVTSVAANGGYGVNVTGTPITSTGTIGIAIDSTKWITKTGLVAKGYISGNQAITLSGDVTGTGSTAITTTVAALQGRSISTTAPSTGQILEYNGTNWAPTTFTAGTVTSVTASSPLASSGGATPVISLTGIVSVTNGGTGLSTFGGTNTMLYTTAANTLSSLTTADNGILITSATGVPSIGTTLPLAVQGNITSVGTITSGTWNGTAVAVANGGTGATTITSHGVVYGNGISAVSATAAGTQGQVLTVNSSGIPVFTTATYPATTTVNQLLYSSAANTVTGLAVGTTGQVLTTNSSGVPTWATPTSGTVTSVALSMPSIFTVTNSPVTSTGTLTSTLTSQTANTVLASPNGSTGTPVFRALVNADLPLSGAVAGTYNNIVINGQGIATNGSNVSYLTSAVTNVAASGGYGVNVTGSPITSTGTINVAIDSTKWITKSALAAKGYITNNQTITLSGDVSGSGSTTISTTVAGLQGKTVSSTTPSTGQVLEYNGTTWIPTTPNAGTITGVTASLPLASSGGTTPTISLSGTVPVANGGTGATTLTSNGIIYGNGTGALGATTAGTQGQILSVNSLGVPVFTTAAYPTTTTANQLLYSSAANTITGLAVGTTGQVLTTNSSGALAWASVGTGTVTGVTATSPLASSGGASPNITLTGIIPIANGGTNSSTALSGSGIIVSNGTQIVQGAAGTTTTLLHGNASGAPTYSAANLTTDVTGTLPIANGGTGLTSYTAGSLLDASSSSVVGQIADVTAGSYLRSGGSGSVPVWSSLTLPNAATTGDILYASGTNAIGNLSDVATGNVLISGGTSTAPTWGKVALASAVSGTLLVANGGTGATTLTSNGVMYGNGTGGVGITAAPTPFQVLVGSLSGPPSFMSLSGDLTMNGSGGLIITGLQGYSVSSTTPSTGQVLQWNGSAWTPTTNGSGTVTSVTAGNGLIGGAITTSGTIALPYTELVATLTQSGTSAPTDTVVYNNTGGTITLAYVAAGEYSLTISGASFHSANLTQAYITSGISTVATSASVVFASKTVLDIYTAKNNTGTNGCLTNSPIDIRIY